MEQYYEYCLAAVIILIPLTSISHFIPPLPICMQADLCNHTWIPECAQEWDYDYRMFIDECDVIEYNCDYDRNYTITNYSDCFSGICPPIPTCPACPTCPVCKKGNWIRRNGRRVNFDPIAIIPMNNRRRRIKHDHYGHEGHDHFAEHVHLRNGYRGFGPVPANVETARLPDRTRGRGRRTRYSVQPGRRLREITKNRKTTKKPKRTTVRTKKMLNVPTRTIKQVIETATTTIYHPEIRRITVMRNGKMYFKVVKYLTNVKIGTVRLVDHAASKNDSDFIEK